MDCNQFNRQLDDWLDGELDSPAAAMLAAHAERCRACTHCLAEERRLRAALRQLSVPPPRRGFAAEALRVARLADRANLRKNWRHDWMLAFAGAAAATLCISIVMWVRQGQSEPAPVLASVAQPPAPAIVTQASLQTVAMTVGKVESLRLRIEAPRDFTDVRFSVDLPDHVSLAGQPGIRAMTWQGQLVKGENVLELPLVAELGAAGLVQTRVSWGAFEQRIDASLISVPAPTGAESAVPAIDGT